MKVRNSIARIAVATMIAATVAVPSASAMSSGVIYGSTEYAAEQQDMHASTVHKPASSAGDLRGEGSIAGSRAQAHAGVVKADHRTEAAKGPSMSTSPPGLPTWPVDPKPIAPAPADVITATDGDGGGIDWPIVLLIAAGAVALAGALVLTVHQSRRTQARPTS
jgi:hypothetical protein